MFACWRATAPAISRHGSFWTSSTSSERSSYSWDLHEGARRRAQHQTILGFVSQPSWQAIWRGGAGAAGLSGVAWSPERAYEASARGLGGGGVDLHGVGRGVERDGVGRQRVRFSRRSPGGLEGVEVGDEEVVVGPAAGASPRRGWASAISSFTLLWRVGSRASDLLILKTPSRAPWRLNHGQTAQRCPREIVPFGTPATQPRRWTPVPRHRHVSPRRRGSSLALRTTATVRTRTR